MKLMDLIWLGLMVVFLIAEAACPLHLISVWFAAGSLAALAVSLLGGPVWLQVALFVVVSGALLAALWPLAKKYMAPKLTPTNADALIGTLGIVTAPIDNLAACGQVKLGGMEWTARSADGSPIEAGTKVKVDHIEGVKAYVYPAEVTV